MLMIIAALSLTACSSTGAEPSTTVAGSDDTTATTGDDSPQPSPGEEATTTTGDDESTTTSAPETTESTSGRPVAPDFTLELGDGGRYTLSEGSKPVYMIFWAEW